MGLQNFRETAKRLRRYQKENEIIRKTIIASVIGIGLWAFIQFAAWFNHAS